MTSEKKKMKNAVIGRRSMHSWERKTHIGGALDIKIQDIKLQISRIKNPKDETSNISGRDVNKSPL